MGSEILVGTETVCQVALTRIPTIGPATTRKLIQVFGDAGSVFRAPSQALRELGLREATVVAIKSFSGWGGVEAELHRMTKNGIRPLFFTDKDYPQRLQKIPDTPVLLFYKGNADLNAERIVAVVGTRYPSSYGLTVTAHLIRQMMCPGLLVISGLAIGIDAAAHTAALKNCLPTVGILGHGLGHVYPSENKGLAKEMVKDGGLLTAHEYDDKPESFHFPDRNRIVAALCDALIVVESGKSGGSMLTVDAAIKYEKDVFAVPGRIMETRSAGCNALIGQGRARMLTSGSKLVADLGWAWPDGGRGVQGELSLHQGALNQGALNQCGLTGDAGQTKPEEQLLGLLKDRGSLDIDEIARQTGQSSSGLALLLLRLEVTGRVIAMPGKRYRFNVAATQA